MVVHMTYTELADRLWARLEPLGWSRYEGTHQPAGIQFYAPGVDAGFIEIAGLCHGGQLADIHISIGAVPVWADGLRVVADELDAA